MAIGSAKHFQMKFGVFLLFEAVWCESGKHSYEHYRSTQGEIITIDIKGI